MKPKAFYRLNLLFRFLFIEPTLFLVTNVNVIPAIFKVLNVIYFNTILQVQLYSVSICYLLDPKVLNLYLKVK